MLAVPPHGEYMYRLLGKEEEFGLDIPTTFYIGFCEYVTQRRERKPRERPGHACDICHVRGGDLMHPCYMCTYLVHPTCWKSQVNKKLCHMCKEYRCHMAPYMVLYDHRAGKTRVMGFGKTSKRTLTTKHANGVDMVYKHEQKSPFLLRRSKDYRHVYVPCKEMHFILDAGSKTIVFGRRAVHVSYTTQKTE